MKRSIRNNILWGVAILIIAFTLGRITDWSYFELSKEVSLVDIITLAVTIWLAYYVAQVLEKDVQNIQGGKQLVIERLTLSEDFLKKIASLLDQTQHPYIVVVNSVHKYQTKMDSALSSLKSHNKYYSGLDNQISEIERQGGKVKRLLTNTPVDREQQSDIRMIDGVIWYSQNRLREIENTVGLLENAIFDLKHTINYL